MTTATMTAPTADPPIDQPFSRPRTLDEALAIVYPFAVIPEPTGGYDIVFPDLPGCTSHALTLEEIPEQARESSAMWVEGMFGMNYPLPEPSSDWDPRPAWPTEPLTRLDGQPDPAPQPIYTAEYVADLLDVTPARIRQLATQYDVGVKTAGVWMFTPEDVVVMQGRPGRRRPARPGIAVASSAD